MGYSSQNFNSGLNNFNSGLNNFNSGLNNNNGSDEGGGGFVLIALFVFLVIFVSIIFALVKSGNLKKIISKLTGRNATVNGGVTPTTVIGGAPGTAKAPGSSRAPGAKVPTQAGGGAAASTPSAFDNVMQSLAANAAYIGISVGVDIAAELLQNQKAIGKAIMKRGMKASGSKAVFDKGASKALKKTFTGRMNRIASRLTTKAMMAMGARWPKTAARLGMSYANIAARVAAEAGQQAAEFAARMAAQRAAQQAAKSAMALSLGPIGLLYDAVTVVGIALDVANAGNFAELAQTSDLLVIKKEIDREVLNVNLACSTIPMGADCPIDPDAPPPEPDPDATPRQGRWPSFVGPLDAEMSADMTAFYTKLNDKMVDLVTTKPYRPNVQAIFDKVNTDHGQVFIDAFTTAGLDPNTMTIPSITDAYFAQVFQAYWTDADSDYFYEKALDSLCADAGGSSFSPGPGYDRQCSYKTEADCHAAYPWPPPDDDSKDLTYTEWRANSWFTSLKNTDGSSTFDTSKMPAAGACIAASTGLHQMCDEEITTGSGAFARTARNDYIRNTGECVNSEDLCRIKGVAFRRSMTPSEMAWLTDHDLPSCYVTDDMKICEAVIGVTICRSIGIIGTAFAIAEDGIIETMGYINEGVDIAAQGAAGLMNLDLSTGDPVVDGLALQAEGAAATVGAVYLNLVDNTFGVGEGLLAGGQQSYGQIEAQLQNSAQGVLNNFENLAEQAEGGSATAALGLVAVAASAAIGLGIAATVSAFSALDTAITASRNQTYPDPVWCGQGRQTCRPGEKLLPTGGQYDAGCTEYRCFCQDDNANPGIITNGICCPNYHTGSYINGVAKCTPNPYPDWWNTFVQGSCQRQHFVQGSECVGQTITYPERCYEDYPVVEDTWYDDWGPVVGSRYDYNNPTRVCAPPITDCDGRGRRDVQVLGWSTPVTIFPRDPRDFATRQDYCNSGSTAQELADQTANAAAAAAAAQEAADWVESATQAYEAQNQVFWSGYD